MLKQSKHRRPPPDLPFFLSEIHLEINIIFLFFQEEIYRLEKGIESDQKLKVGNIFLELGFYFSKSFWIYDYSDLALMTLAIGK